MSKEKDRVRQWGCLGLFAFYILCYGLLVCFIMGCTRTVYIPTETVRYEKAEADTAAFNAVVRMLTDKLQRSQHTTDSLLRKESERTVVNPDGDTLRHDTHVYEYHATSKVEELTHLLALKTDSISVLREQLSHASADTIRDPYPVEVEKKHTLWENVKLNLGGYAMAALLIVAIILIGRRKFFML